MNDEERKRKRLLAAVMGGFAAWGGLLAVGTFLGLDAQTPSYDYRRFLVVAGVTAGILAFWGLALRARSRRLLRQQPTASPTSTAPRPGPATTPKS